MYKTTVNQRFISAINFLIREGKAKNKTEIADILGSTNSKFSEILKERMNAGVDMIGKLCDNYNVNAEWLLTGNGEMLKSENLPVLHEEKIKLIPFYDDVSSIGGTNGYIADMQSVSKPTEMINAGSWFPEATDAIRHYGDSMIEYPSGCILTLKEVSNIQSIIWGRDYVIETEEYRITKRIQKGKTEGYLRAYSSNEEIYADGTLIHEPVDVEINSIRKIALVLGYVVKKHSSGMVSTTYRK